MENNSNSGTNTILLVLILLVLVAGIVWFFRAAPADTQPADTGDGTSIEVSLPSGDDSGDNGAGSNTGETTP